MLVYQSVLHVIMVIRIFREQSFPNSRKIHYTSRPGWSVPLPIMLFLWNLGLHQLVSAWFIPLCYRVGSMGDANLPFTPTLVPYSRMIGHIGLASLFKQEPLDEMLGVALPVFATVLRMFGANGLYKLCRQQAMDSLETPSTSNKNSPRRSFSSRAEGTSFQQVSGTSHISLRDEECSCSNFPGDRRPYQATETSDLQEYPRPRSSSSIDRNTTFQ